MDGGQVVRKKSSCESFGGLFGGLVVAMWGVGGDVVVGEVDRNGKWECTKVVVVVARTQEASVVRVVVVKACPGGRMGGGLGLSTARRGYNRRGCLAKHRLRQKRLRQKRKQCARKMKGGRVEIQSFFYAKRLRPEFKDDPT
jgi:hypothetical protein